MTPTTRRRLLCAALAGGYALLLIETLLEHHDVFAERWQSWLPPITAGIGLPAMGLAAAYWRRGPRRAAIGLALLSVLVGLAGLLLHNADRLEHGFDLELMVPPPLAPLAFAGQGLLALLVLWGNGGEPT